MRSFWSKIHCNWVELWHALSGVHDFSALARRVACEEYSDAAGITVAVDLKLCKKFHSNRVVAYLYAIQDNPLVDEILHEFQQSRDSNQDGQAVWQGCHPLPA
jgi:hypothetical protein